MTRGPGASRAPPSPFQHPSLIPLLPHRFGSRCARIFRLLLRKKHLEQKQVEDFAMIPAKEAKDMLYRMLSENLVSLQVRDLQDPGELCVPTGEGALGSQRFPRWNSCLGDRHFRALPSDPTWNPGTGSPLGRGNPMGKVT